MEHDLGRLKFIFKAMVSQRYKVDSEIGCSSFVINPANDHTEKHDGRKMCGDVPIATLLIPRLAHKKTFHPCVAACSERT